MALIDCPDCGKQVSSNAPACPNCGAPIATPVVERKSSGGRVPYSDQQVAVLLSQKSKTSHLLHFFLSLFTIGIWIPIWIFVSIVNGIANGSVDAIIAKGKKV